MSWKGGLMDMEGLVLKPSSGEWATYWLHLGGMGGRQEKEIRE